MDSWWGGTAYESNRKVDLDGGFKHLSDVFFSEVREDHRWWLGRKNPVLPFAPFNILIQDVPSFDVFEGRSRYVMFKGRLYSMEEIERLFELDIRDVRRWRHDILDDNKLMEKIVEESQV